MIGKAEEKPYIDPQMAIVLNKMIEKIKSKPPSWTRPITEVRQNFIKNQGYWNTDAPVLPRVENKTIPGPFGPVSVRLYDPGGTNATLPLLVFFHGGGWVAGSVDTHDYLSRFLAEKSGVVVISVEYGLAPERRFPDTVKECVDAVTWLSQNGKQWGLDTARIAIGGDSAGILHTCKVYDGVTHGFMQMVKEIDTARTAALDAANELKKSFF
ncbi:MAG: alpha/beta hydrolase fold domain-containing protein [Spirochaetota bacterium]